VPAWLAASCALCASFFYLQAKPLWRRRYRVKTPGVVGRQRWLKSRDGRGARRQQRTGWRLRLANAFKQTRGDRAGHLPADSVRRSAAPCCVCVGVAGFATTSPRTALFRCAYLSAACAHIASSPVWAGVHRFFLCHARLPPLLHISHLCHSFSLTWFSPRHLSSLPHAAAPYPIAARRFCASRLSGRIRCLALHKRWHVKTSKCVSAVSPLHRSRCRCLHGWFFARVAFGAPPPRSTAHRGRKAPAPASGMVAQAGSADERICSRCTPRTAYGCCLRLRAASGGRHGGRDENVIYGKRTSRLPCGDSGMRAGNSETR